MAEIKCTYCGGPYCDLEKREESFEKIIRHYYCNSCKKRFRTCYTKPVPSGTWLLSLHSDYDRDIVEFYRDTDGSIYYRAKISINNDITETYDEIFMVTHDAAIIQALGCEISISIPKKAYSVYCRTIKMNEEMIKNALENHAMRAIYVGNNCFNAFPLRNDLLRDDVARWLRATLHAREREPSSRGCYVATSIYGSYDCPQVWTLRRFRDNILSSTWYGRTFIRVYYTLSPKIVSLLGNATWFRKIMRKRLDKLVRKLQIKGLEDTPYQDRNW